MWRRSVVALLALCGGLVLAAPAREKRQAGCLSSFQNVPNVCQHNPNGQTFFPHPSDPTKFLQCDIYNRMYIIQCPQGEVFQLSTTSCQQSQQPITSLPATTPPPVVTTKPPATTPPPVVTTKPPVTTPPPRTTPAPATTAAAVVGNNPCNAQSIAWGQLYFPHVTDRTKFYRCDQQGHPSIVDCPTLMVWDQTILSCVYQLGGQPKPTPQILPDQPNNPCTAQAIKEGRFFFPHLEQNKYIQCDLSRNAYINSCPAHLQWNIFLETCYNPALNGRK